MLLSTLLVLVGAGLLYGGGELLIENSIRLAKGFGVSSLVIGLTVVAFATSAPELATTLTAATTRPCSGSAKPADDWKPLWPKVRREA